MTEHMPFELEPANANEETYTGRPVTRTPPKTPPQDYSNLIEEPAAPPPYRPPVMHAAPKPKAPPPRAREIDFSSDSRSEYRLSMLSCAGGNPAGRQGLEIALIRLVSRMGGRVKRIDIARDNETDACLLTAILALKPARSGCTAAPEALVEKLSAFAASRDFEMRLAPASAPLKIALVGDEGHFITNRLLYKSLLGSLPVSVPLVVNASSGRGADLMLDLQDIEQRPLIHHGDRLADEIEAELRAGLAKGRIDYVIFAPGAPGPSEAMRRECEGQILMLWAGHALPGHLCNRPFADQVAGGGRILSASAGFMLAGKGSAKGIEDRPILEQDVKILAPDATPREAAHQGRLLTAELAETALRQLSAGRACLHRRRILHAMPQ